MIVNGEQTTIREGLSLAEYLDNNGYNPARIAVERNGNIVPKSEYSYVILAPDDVLEIVQFVGGG